jgi:serine/threonine protein phosphatase 1
MRTLAIGDIHGCTRALDTLLAEVQPSPEDLIVTLGDYVDRGPDSRGAIDRLLALRESHQLVALRGNHDFMMVEARRNYETRETWLGFGGREALASYGIPDDDIDWDRVPAAHWDFLENVCVDWHEMPTHFFVHANVYPELPLADQPEYMLHWERLVPFRRPHVSGKMMICGHTSQKSGLPLVLKSAICIDTWVYGRGWLTCLAVESGSIWQANQAGDKRTAQLDEHAPGGVRFS